MSIHNGTGGYQDPNFDKDRYWKIRQMVKSGRMPHPFRPKIGRIVMLDKNGRVPQAHVGGKTVSKKAFRKNTRRARAYQSVAGAGR